MQFPGQGKPPVGIVLDTLMGRSIDSALALSLLYGFDGKNEVRVVSMSLTNSNLSAAAFVDAVGRFYAGAVNSGFGGFMRSLPTGLAVDGKFKDDTPMLLEPLAKKTADGAPSHPHSIHTVNDTADPAALIRNAFTSQHDQNCVALLTGPATNLVKILALPGVKDLVKQKVRFLCVAGGAFPDGPAEANVAGDIPSAKKLFAEWPTPIVAVGAEVGKSVMFPGASIEKDFAWSPSHPVVDAYRAAKPMPYDAPAGDMLAVLYAARPQEGYFQMSPTGTIAVLDDGRTKFTEAPGGTHRYLIPDPAQNERIVKVLTEVSSAKPVPRIPRFRQQQKEEEPPPK